MESKQFLEILCLQVMGWYLSPKTKPAKSIVEQMFGSRTLDL